MPGASTNRTHDEGPPAPSCARLRLRFDAERLAEDLIAILGEARPAELGGAHGSGWLEVVLRAPGGDPRLFPGSREPGDYAATPALARCPALREVLERLECPLLGARLCVLSPSGLAREDAPRPSEDGRIELRVAIRTGPEVRVRVGRSRAEMQPGEVWWLAARETIRVEGRDHAELVVECLSSEWLRRELEQAVPAPDASELAAPPVEPGSLAASLRAALSDAVIAARLTSARSLEALVEPLARGPRRDDWITALASARPHGVEVPLDEWPAGEGWVPAEVEWRGAEPVFHLAWLGADADEAPFFEDALRISRRGALCRHVRPRVSLATLERFVAERPRPPLVGLIAHVSRCGSTLVARALASTGSIVVASEPPPLDTVLRQGPPDLPWSLRARAIRATTAALGRWRTGRETGLVVKLDAWHLASMDRLDEAFPTTPRVLLYRAPAEVLASQMRVPGLQMVPGLLGPPFDAIEAGAPVLEHRARIVGLLFELAAKLERTLLVSYDELPAAISARIAPHFGVTLGASERDAIAAASRVDAKSPTQPFVRSAPAPNDEGPALAAAAERWAGAHHRLLEQRSARGATT